MEGQIENSIFRIVKDLFQKAGFSLESLNIEKTQGPENQELFIAKVISSDDCSFLLDSQGKNLKALEHLVRLVALKELNQKANLILDLNNFIEKRNGKISELARLIAKKVQATQKAHVLGPMSAYERRLIHLELATWSDITTESIGEEPRRRVVVKPYP